VFASGAHATLPRVYNQSDVTGDRWETLMNICFFIISIVYAVMGGCGYLTYGDTVHVLVTEDLVQYPGGLTPTVATWLILIGSFCKISPLMVVAGECTEGVVGIVKPWQQRLLRTILFSAVSVTAYLLRNDVDLIEAMTGSVATSITALIVPAVGYALVSGAFHVSTWSDVGTLVGVALTILLSVLLVVGNTIEVCNRLE